MDRSIFEIHVVCDILKIELNLTVSRIALERYEEHFQNQMGLYLLDTSIQYKFNKL